MDEDAALRAMQEAIAEHMEAWDGLTLEQKLARLPSLSRQEMVRQESLMWWTYTLRLMVHPPMLIALALAGELDKLHDAHPERTPGELLQVLPMADVLDEEAQQLWWVRRISWLRLRAWGAVEEGALWPSLDT